MNPCGMILELHQILEHKLHTFIVEEKTVLIRSKYVMLIKVMLQQIFAAENMLLF